MSEHKIKAGTITEFAQMLLKHLIIMKINNVSMLSARTDVPVSLITFVRCVVPNGKNIIYEA